MGPLRERFRDEGKGLELRRRGYRREWEEHKGRKGYWGHTSTSQPKEGPVRGRLREPSQLLAGTMWSSLLPPSWFWGSLFYTQTVAVAPTRSAKRCIQTGSSKKRCGSGGGLRWEGEQGYSEGQWACPECQIFQATDVMPVPTVGERRRDRGTPFLPPSTLHCLFFFFARMNESFRSGSPLFSVIDSDYPNFMEPSQSEEVPWVLPLRTTAMQQGPRLVALATLWFTEKGDEAHSHTHTSHANTWGCNMAGNSGQ